MQQRGVYTVSTGLGGEWSFASQRPKDYYADEAFVHPIVSDGRSQPEMDM